MSDITEPPEPTNEVAESGRELPASPDTLPVVAEMSTKASRVEARWDRVYRWAGRRGLLKRPIRALIGPSYNRAISRATVEFWSTNDAAENEKTRLPDNEQIALPALWLAEIYTPTTRAGLVRLRDYVALAKLPHRNQDIERMISSTRLDRMRVVSPLPWVVPSDSGIFVPERIVDKLPPRIAHVGLTLLSVTPSITVLVFEFVLKEEDGLRLNEVINADRATTIRRTGKTRRSILHVENQKRGDVAEFRKSIQKDAENWIRMRVPGFFSESSSGSFPAIELLATQLADPFEPNDSTSRPDPYRDMLDLENWLGYWRCVDYDYFRLSQSRFDEFLAPRSYRLALAAQMSALADNRLPHTGIGTTNHEILSAAIQAIGAWLPALLSRWALTALLSEVDRYLSLLRDEAMASMGGNSARELIALRDSLLRVGLDSRIVATEIVEFAAEQDEWEYGVPDFAFVTHDGRSTESLSSVLRKGQRATGKRVGQVESDLGELLSTSADLTGSVQNLRLQGKVLWLTVVSSIIAIVALGVSLLPYIDSGRHGNSTTPTQPPATFAPSVTPTPALPSAT